MGAGLVLAVGLLAARGVANRRSPIANREEEWSGEDGKSDADILRRNLGLARLLQLSLVVAMFMMGVGLVMSYSRGAWLGTALGLQYLAKRHGKFSWRWVLAGILVAAAVTIGFWHRTMDDAPWYIMRLDLSRPSAQHRVAAWHGALQMMWDHPFGVGWDNAAIVYGKNYLPPKNGIAAITTNDYLMLGTQLGWPALICFVAYVGLCLKAERVTLCAPRLGSCQDSAREVWRPAILLGLFPPRRPGTFRQESTSPLTRRLSLATLDTFATPRQYEGALIQAASRSAALSMLVAFWFNSGLFDLATASIFWILLELGKIETKAKR